MTEGLARTGDGGLAYRVDGPEGAPPVLLCNALGTTLELWDAQASVLARRFRVIRYDGRGHGRSTVVPGEYRIDDLGRDALAVLDAVGVDAAHAAGISLGGLTVMWLGINQPGRVRRLLIANSAARVGPPERWTDRVALVRRSGMDAVAELVPSNWFTPEFREHAPEVADRFRRMVASCPPDGYAGCCAALREADLRDELSRIQAPTLVVAGSRDPSTTLADAALVADRIPNAALYELPCAHLSNVECAEAFTERTAAFFSA